MSYLARLRVKICATAFVLGIAAAFLAYTTRGLLVLGIAVVVAGVLALCLWAARPELFLPRGNVGDGVTADAGDYAGASGGRRAAGTTGVGRIPPIPPLWPAADPQSAPTNRRERVS